MKKRQKLVTDEQWELIAPLLPEGRRRKDNRGRPWASNRACFEGILWICVWQVFLAQLWQLTLAHLGQVAGQRRGMEMRWASGWSVAEARSPAGAAISPQV